MNASALDAAGVAHETAGGQVRIVSLVPSITELLFALGLGQQIVGRTGFCVHPRDQVRHVPKVGGTKTVKLEAIRALRATHVIVNIDENERDTVDRLRLFVPHIVVTHPQAPRDNLALYALLGAIFERGEAAQRLCAALEARLAEAETAAQAWPAARVLYLIWRAPWMAVARDTYISAMLRLVNWRTMPGVQGGPTGAARYPTIDFDAPWLAEVEHVLLSSEPYRFTATHRDALASDPRLAGKRIALIDGEQVSWYGSRAIEGVAYLARYASMAFTR